MRYGKTAFACQGFQKGQEALFSRLDGLPGVKVGVVAFGEKGAFGEPEQVNRFRR